MDKESLIQRLNAEYQKTLPDIDESYSGYIRESTNTLICIGGIKEGLSDIEKARMYFKQAQVELLRGNVRPEDRQKVEYCKIAEEAISEILAQRK